MTLKTVARQFYLKGHFVLQKLGMKFSEMRKEMKIKLSGSFRTNKVWGNFFRKKALHGETNFFGIFIMGCFTWGHHRSSKGES